ncbi:MAG TPA: hypothetical protein VI485_08220 [Vicinamibacterales bacterium]|nr:hypothetical protein [Vicinamibacterales bacterium]
MAASLSVGPNSHSANDSRCCVDVNPHDTNRIAAIQQELGVVTGRMFVQVILVVDADMPTGLE